MMKNKMNTNISRELCLDEMEQGNGSGILITVAAIGAWATALTLISYFAGDNEAD